MREDELTAELRRVRDSVHGLGNRIATVEGRIGVIEAKVSNIPHRVAGFGKLAAAIAVGSFPTILTVLGANGHL